jgi:hypothetical protein
MTNLALANNMTSCSHATCGASMTLTKPGATKHRHGYHHRNPPGSPILIQVPVFLTANFSTVTGGSYDATSHTATAASGATRSRSSWRAD